MVSGELLGDSQELKSASKALTEMIGVARETLDMNNDPVILKSSLAEVLNRLIHGPLIDPEKCFSPIRLRAATAALLESHPKSPSHEELVRLNRMVLEDAYP